MVFPEAKGKVMVDNRLFSGFLLVGLRWLGVFLYAGWARRRSTACLILGKPATPLPKHSLSGSVAMEGYYPFFRLDELSAGCRYTTCDCQRANSLPRKAVKPSDARLSDHHSRRSPSC